MSTTITSKRTVRRFALNTTSFVATLVLIAMAIVLVTALYFTVLQALTTGAAASAASNVALDQHDRHPGAGVAVSQTRFGEMASYAASIFGSLPVANLGQQLPGANLTGGANLQPFGEMASYAASSFGSAPQANAAIVTGTNAPYQQRVGEWASYAASIFGALDQHDRHPAVNSAVDDPLIERNLELQARRAASDTSCNSLTYKFGWAMCFGVR